MIESPGFATILAMVALATALVVHDRPPRILLWAGALLLVGSWVPIVAAGLLDPSGESVGNAMGLGLFAWFGSTLGLIVAVFGILWELALTTLRKIS
jgi:hypothetical protein